MKDKIERYSIPVPVTGCWLWTGSLNGHGYGKVRDRDSRLQTAHRASYRAFVGPIPEGLDLDHKCRVRCCVNPAHLEPVTRSENLRRSPLAGKYARKLVTACRAGHAFDESNTRWGTSGYRECLTCRRERQRQSRSRIRCEEAA